MRVHNDEAIDLAERDCLRFDAVATQVATLAYTCEAPFTLGLHGDWGSGKTSLLHLVKQRLMNPPAGVSARPVTTVFFEAWRHQFEPQPAVALLHTLRDHFAIERSMWEKGGESLKVGIYTGLRLLSDITTGIASLGTIPKGTVETLREERDRAQGASFSLPLTSRAFRETFEKAIEHLVVNPRAPKQTNGRLVVLVDDLDRCSDEAIVRLLEAIKLYLSAKNELRAALYCGKLFQAVKELPYMAEPWSYVERLLQDEDGAALTGLDAAVVAIEREHAVLPPNPRAIKRFLTELYLRELSVTGKEPRLLVAIQALQTFHPTLYRILESNPTFYQELEAFASNRAYQDKEGHLDGVELPERAQEDPLAATGPGEWRARNLDPGNGAVLRCARLLREIAPVDGDLLRAHLLHARSPR